MSEPSVRSRRAYELGWRDAAEIDAIRLEYGVYRIQTIVLVNVVADIIEILSGMDCCANRRVCNVCVPVEIVWVCLHRSMELRGSRV